MSKIALPCILILAAALRLWHLGDHGFGTEYYAAAVRSMLLNWHNFFFNAFDPTGTLMVDKPPLALWAQVLSVHELGFSPFALMLPQAVEGTASVWVIWRLVRRDFGNAAALLAAVFLAITPISIAVDRSNNTDGLLVLVLLLAAWALPKSGDKAAAWRFTAAMALVGVAFNVKMLAAYGVLPGFVASYFFTATASFWRRIQHLAIGGLLLLTVSGSWIGAVALTPADQRPYVDSSPVNSIFDLVVNHNAAQRFIPRAWRETPVVAPQQPAPRLAFQQRIAPPGASRLADPALASQALWLLPLALAGAVAMVMTTAQSAAYMWVGWAVAYGMVFSYAGGLFSPYYLVVLAPPLAALAAVGAVALGRRVLSDSGFWQRSALPVFLAANVLWQVHVLRAAPDDLASGAVLGAVMIGGVLALTGLTVAWLRKNSGIATAALVTAIAALLIAPGAWAVGTIRAAGGRPIARLEPATPRANPAYRGRGNLYASNETAAVRAELPFLLENRNGAQFLAAADSTRLAAPLIIATGAPVLAFGGFEGTMPVADDATLARLAQTGAVRFVLLSSGNRRRPQGQSIATQWVRTHGKLHELDDAPSEEPRPRLELYDLRPDLPTMPKTVKNERAP